MSRCPEQVIDLKMLDECHHVSRPYSFRLGEGGAGGKNWFAGASVHQLLMEVFPCTDLEGASSWGPHGGMNCSPDRRRSYSLAVLALMEDLATSRPFTCMQAWAAGVGRVELVLSQAQFLSFTLMAKSLAASRSSRSACGDLPL